MSSSGKKKPTSRDTGARERIEQAASDLFAERDFDDVSPIDIANRARSSLQTLYSHYGGKNGLLKVCVDNALSELAERLMDHLQGIKGYKDRLRKFFWVTLEFCERDHRLGQLLLSSTYISSWRSDDPAFRQDALSHMFISVLREGQKNGHLNDRVAPAILLDYMYGVLFRLIWMHYARSNEDSLAAQSDELFEMLWQALRARGPDTAESSDESDQEPAREHGTGA